MFNSYTDEWDAICTCFFIDTAHNIIEYIETIYHILKPGGIWINLGPLLYHYYDMPGEPSLELTLDQVLRIVKAVGFQIKVILKRMLYKTYIYFIPDTFISRVNIHSKPRLYDEICIQLFLFHCDKTIEVKVLYICEGKIMVNPFKYDRSLDRLSV